LASQRIQHLKSSHRAAQILLFLEPQGLERLREAVQHSSAPVFAIGGIQADRIAEVQAAGAHGIALISALSAARDPRQAAKDLLAKLSARDQAN